MNSKILDTNDKSPLSFSLSTAIDSPITRVALGILAFGSIASLVTGLVLGWDLELLIGLGSASAVTGITALALQFCRQNKESDSPLRRVPEAFTPLLEDTSFFEESWPQCFEASFPEGYRVVDFRDQRIHPYEEKGSGFFKDKTILPELGHYGRSYPRRPTILGLRLPRAFLSRFPLPIQEKLHSLEEVSLYFVVYAPYFSIYRDFNKKEHNLLLHRIVFPHTEEKANKQKTIEAGLFSTQNIEAGWPSKGHGAIGVDEWKQMSVHIHDEVALSPNSGRFTATENFSSFFAGAKIDEKRGVAIFGIIQGEKSKEVSLEHFMACSFSLSDFVEQTNNESAIPQPIRAQIQQFFS